MLAFLKDLFIREYWFLRSNIRSQSAEFSDSAFNYFFYIWFLPNDGIKIIRKCTTFIKWLGTIFIIFVSTKFGGGTMKIENFQPRCRLKHELQKPGQSTPLNRIIIHFFATKCLHVNFDYVHDSRFFSAYTSIFRMIDHLLVIKKAK